MPIVVIPFFCRQKIMKTQCQGMSCYSPTWTPVPANQNTCRRRRQLANHRARIVTKVLSYWLIQLTKKYAKQLLYFTKKNLDNFDYHVQFIWFTIGGKEIRNSSVIQFLKKVRPGTIFQKEDRIRTLFFQCQIRIHFFLDDKIRI